MEEPMKQCENCLKDINVSKMQLHEAYCFRNIRRCKKCDQPVDKAEMEQHIQENHVLEPCKYCKQQFEKQDLQNHEDGCSLKPEPPKTCQFCNILIDASKYVQHIYMCQNRTSNCEFCQKPFVIRELDLHQKFCLQNQMKEREQMRQEEQREQQMEQQIRQKDDSRSNRNERMKGPFTGQTYNQNLGVNRNQPSSNISRNQPSSNISRNQQNLQQGRGVSDNQNRGMFDNQNIRNSEQQRQNEGQFGEVFDPSQSMMFENDEEIQKAIQESMRNYQDQQRNDLGSQQRQEPRFDPYQSLNYQDEDIQKAIQESMQGNQHNIKSEDDDYIKAIKESMKSAGQEIDSDTERAILESLKHN